MSNLNSRIWEEVGLEYLSKVAIEMLAFADGYKVWLLFGDMGAGKTTFTRLLGQAMGVEDTVNSPTFGIVHEYEVGLGEKLYHFDFYRISGEEEALEIGVEEYLYSGSRCIIEWPRKIEGLWPEKYLEVHFEITGLATRKVKAIKHG